MTSCEKGEFSLNGLPRAVGSLLIIFVFFLFTGCATDAKKPSPVLSQTTDLRKALLEVTEAYEQKDKEAFFSRFDPSFHPLTLFKNQVNRDFEAFSGADIQVTIEQIRIEQESLVTVVRWKGSWTSVSGEPALRKRGHAVFRWTSKPMLRLLEIKGNPPFGVF